MGPPKRLHALTSQLASSLKRGPGRMQQFQFSVALCALATGSWVTPAKIPQSGRQSSSGVEGERDRRCVWTGRAVLVLSGGGDCEAMVRAGSRVVNSWNHGVLKWVSPCPLSTIIKLGEGLSVREQCPHPMCVVSHLPQTQGQAAMLPRATTCVRVCSTLCPVHRRCVTFDARRPILVLLTSFPYVFPACELPSTSSAFQHIPKFLFCHGAVQFSSCSENSYFAATRPSLSPPLGSAVHVFPFIPISSANSVSVLSIVVVCVLRGLGHSLFHVHTTKRQRNILAEVNSSRTYRCGSWRHFLITRDFVPCVQRVTKIGVSRANHVAIHVCFFSTTSEVWRSRIYRNVWQACTDPSLDR